MPEMESPATLSLTFTREQWALIVYLTTQGVFKACGDYIEVKAHSLDCLKGFADAARVLQEAHKSPVPPVSPASTEPEGKPGPDYVWARAPYSREFSWVRKSEVQ